MSSPAALPSCSLVFPQRVAHWQVDRLTRLDDLRAIVPQWESLAASAMEPNVFYEPWMMLPALEHFHRRTRIEVFAVYAELPGRQRRLAALVPFEQKQSCLKFPLRQYTLLRYYYCGLCTPLLDAELGEAALGELLRALERRGGTYDCSHVRATGPVMVALSRHMAALDHVPAVQTISRAELRPTADPESYDASLGKKKRSNFRRNERQLETLGAVHYDTLTDGQPVEQWIDEFLQLEASGWKGRAGSAFASTAEGRSFFRQICLNAHRQGRLEIHALRLDGRAIAGLCLFSAGADLYAFRTAYDERFSRVGPGALLAVWHSRSVHGRPGLACVDSCADPDSQLDNAIWYDRRVLAAFRLDLNGPPLLERVRAFVGQWRVVSVQPLLIQLAAPAWNWSELVIASPMV